jgi:PAS domain S-box-containing protein
MKGEINMQQDVKQLVSEVQELRRRNAELEALLSKAQEAEENIRAVSETALDAVIITDQDGSIVFWNKTAAEIFGYEEADVRGNPITMVISDEAVSEYSAGREHFLEKGYSVFGEKPKQNLAKRKDGSTFPVEFTVSNWKIGDRYYFGGTLRDISEQKQAEALLQQSEKQFRDIFNNANDGILIADSRTGTFREANPAICRMLGYSPDEIKCLGVESIHPAETAPFAIEHFKKMAGGHLVESIELPTKRKDGTVFYADVTAQQMILDGRECLAGFFRDVTERKQHQDELRTSEERFSAIAESSLDAIFIADHDGKILYCNKSVERMFGYTVTELLGKSVELMQRTIDRARYRKIRETYKKNQIVIPQRISEGILLRRDGTEFPVEISTSSWKIEGQLFFGGIIRDITERKRYEEELRKSEERFRSVAESSRDAIYIADQDYRIVFWNQGAEKILGYKGKEILGKSDEILMPGMRTSRHRKTREELVKTGKTTFMNGPVETKAVRKDGTELPAEITVSTWKTGEQYYFSAILRDITERKKYEKALLQEKQFSDTLINNLPGIYTLMDERGKRVRWNRNLEEISGRSAESLKKSSVLSFIHKDDRARVRDGIRDAFKKGYAEGEARMRDKNNAIHHYFYSGRKIEVEEHPYITGYAIDISERKRLEEELTKSQRELERRVKQRTAELSRANDELRVSREYLKKFSGRLLSAREEERKTISRALHDELGSLAVSVNSSISIAREEIIADHPKAALTALDQSQAALRKAIGDLRGLAVNLRPPDLETLGLSAVLTDFIKKFSALAKFKITFRNELGDRKIADAKAIVIYRIVQEALTNITKHAKANQVLVQISTERKTIRLDIADDGAGFNQKKPAGRSDQLTMGIRGMRERVESQQGEFTITSAPKKGTQIHVILPKK